MEQLTTEQIDQNLREVEHLSYAMKLMSDFENRYLKYDEVEELAKMLPDGIREQFLRKLEKAGIRRDLENLERCYLAEGSITADELKGVVELMENQGKITFVEMLEFLKELGIG